MKEFKIATGLFTFDATNGKVRYIDSRFEATYLDDDQLRELETAIRQLRELRHTYLDAQRLKERREPVMVNCMTCGGRGHLDHILPHNGNRARAECSTCNGTGMVLV